MAATRYTTIIEALAEYRRCGWRWGDTDISGGSWFGYHYRAHDGRESVAVSFTEELSVLGRPGCDMAMMPLSPTMTPDEEQAAAAVRADAARAAAYADMAWARELELARYADYKAELARYAETRAALGISGP